LKLDETNETLKTLLRNAVDLGRKEHLAKQEVEKKR